MPASAISLVQFLDFGGLAVAFAKLALDGGHLLAQDRLALAFVERGPGLLADFRRKPEHLHPGCEQPRDALDPGGDVDGFQNLLLLVRLHVQIGGDEIGESAGRAGRLHGGDKLGGRLREELQGLHRHALQVEIARLDIGRADVLLLDAADARHHERPAAQEFAHAEAVLALADEMMRAVRRRDVAHHIADDAGRVHVDGGRIGDIGRALHQDADLALLLDGALGNLDRAGPADRDRQDDARKQHRFAHGQDHDCVGRQFRHGLGQAFLALLAFHFHAVSVHLNLLLGIVQENLRRLMRRHPLAALLAI